MRSSTPVAALPRRDIAIILSTVAVLTALAWAYLLYLDRQMSSAVAYDAMMASMGMASDQPWGPADVFFTFLMWMVMMVGMMAASAAPVFLLFAAARAGRGTTAGTTAEVVLFAAGYLAIWAGFSACAALLQWVLHQAALLSPAMAVSSSKLGGAILVGAGAYQLTPVKGACLTECRSPLGFLMTRWRDGALGAFQMGARHGIACLGCCWALMAILFAVGVMNLLWVAGIAIFVLAEKIGPAGRLVARIAGVAMILFGVRLVIAF